MAIRDLERVLGIKSEVKPQTHQNNDGEWKSYTILRQKTATGYVFYGTGRFKGLRVVSEEPIPPVMGEIFKGVDIFKAVRIKDINKYEEGFRVQKE